MNLKNLGNGKRDVAVIGIGFRIPSGNNVKSISETKELFNSLLNGFDGTIETNERWSNNYSVTGDIACKYAGLLPTDEIKSFDPMFFGINPSEASTIDPQQRLLLKCTWEALEDAGIDPVSLRGTNTSVFVGSSTIDYFHMNKSPNETLVNIFGSSTHSCANRISFCFDVRGESLTIDTACSSSLNAINLGYKSINNGQSNISIVGGCNLLLDPNVSRSFTHMGILSPTGKCKSFSAEADGYVRAETVGIAILKSLDQAIRDGNNIYCVINGSNSNVDGNCDKANFYSPSKSLQCENINCAIESTNGTVSKQDIDYFECHGTGTPTGDPIELEGISMVFKDLNKKDPLLIGSIKSNIGHGEASSGVMSLIKCCIMFKYQTFLPNINFKTPNPSIKFDEWNLKVVTEPLHFNSNKLTTMAINNFGVTGSNCCLILQEYNDSSNNKNNNIENSNKKQYLIPFSSNSSTSLNNYKQKVLDLSNSIKFNQFVINQIYNKSQSLVQRSVIIASDWDDFKNEKNEIKSNQSKISNITIENKKPTTVFVLCGQGSQYNKMALSLYENEPYYKQWVDKFDLELSKYYGYSILQKLRSIPDNDPISIHEPILAQPANVMVQVSLFELYKHWGVSPDIIVGHSLGEVSSPYCSGMIDFETLCYLTYHRSVAQNKTTGTGRMLSINISPEEYKSSYSSKYPLLEIACYNSPTSIVVVGKENTLNELSKELKSKDVFCAMLGSLSSFHSSSQLMIKDEVLSMNFESQQPKIPVFSTVTTNLFNSSTPFNSKYVFDNVLEPVYFTQTISNIYKYLETNDLGNEVVFIEVAPHPTLQYYLNQMKSQQSEYFSKGDKITIYSACNKKKNDYQEFLKTISMLYVNHSYGINFKSQINNNSNSLKINLPLYQFDDKHYWKENINNIKIKNDGPATQYLGNSNDLPFPVYQTFIDIKKPPFQWLKGHIIKEKCYFPGTGYIDNLIKLYPNQDVTINSMECKTPFILTEGISSCLQTTINSMAKNEYNFRCHFKDTKTNQWVNSSLGNFSLINHGETNKINIEELKNQCNFSRLSKEEMYETLRIKSGLPYKGLFQGVKECFMGDGCSLSIVSLNEIQNIKEYNHLQDNISMNSFFNAAILDTCLHGILGLVNNSVVLDRIEGLKYYSSNIPKSKDVHKQVYVYSEIKERVNPFSLSGFVKIMLEDGTLLIEISTIVCTSVTLTPMTDSTLILPPPSNEIYTPYLQSKDSSINQPKSFKYLYENQELSVNENDSYLINPNLLLSLFYKHINQRCPQINFDTLSTMDYQNFKQLYYKESINQNFFEFIFNNLKQHYENYIKNGTIEFNKEEITQYYELFVKTTKIMAKQIFPLENDDPNIDTPQSLFENGFLDDFYQNSKVVQPLNKLLSEITLESIKPIINEPMVFRILEFGGGVGSLSILILEKINKLLKENPSYQIDIEYTWSDISSSFFSNIKEKLSIFKNVNVVYKVLDLDNGLINKQDLNPSYYDMVVMSNVMHCVKYLQYSLTQVNQILTPNGQLLLIEPPYKSMQYDSIFGCFSQWWSFEDKELRNDRCCMKQEKWVKLLNDCNYRDTQISGNDNLVFLIQTRKPTVSELLEKENEKEKLEQLSSFDNIILFGGNDDDHISSIVKSNSLISSKVVSINSYKQFNQYIERSDFKGNSQTLIIFLKALKSVDINNFKEITLEYIQINQFILKSGLKNNIKHILITSNSTNDNYLSSSIIGAARYFVEFPELNLCTIDFDKDSTKNKSNLLQLIDYLIDSSKNIQKEFTISNNKVYYERYKKQVNIKNNFKSVSFETDREQLMVRLDSNLEYKLRPKVKQLKPNEVEVEIKGTSINYKDYLMYIGMVGSDLDIKYGREEELENGGLDSPNIGNDFSGIITRCGSNVKKYKIGDQVCGVASKTNGSHVIIDKNYLYYKPSNITHVEAASIPSIYMTSLHSIYHIGNLQPNEAILIHSATGGVGLSALELLKYKKHQGYIFVTVGSSEKEKYLRDKYGSFITDIYSSRTKNYVKQIKDKLKSLGCKKQNQGVDLILNTLSSEYMDSNFQCLNICGRITDLSITHLTPNDYMDYNKFKFNQGYHNVEIVEFTGKQIKFYLKKILSSIESNKLELIPIIEYSNTQFKDAIQYINERKHIGKIVVNHDNDIISNIISNQSNYNNSIVMKNSYDISNLNFGKNILLTGQTGIILEILKWLVKYSNQSIENIIILSKSKLKWELELIMNKTRNQENNKINFHFREIDISDPKEINKVLNELEIGSSICNINSIIHFAFINDIGDVKDVNMDRLNNAHGAKTIGAINLHNESINRKWDIKQFILASSIVSICGSNLQCCYVSACSVIDSLSKYRKSIGLPSLAINLGAISSTGFVSRNESIEQMFHSSILKLFSPQLILSSLDLFVQNINNYSNYCLSDFDFENLPSKLTNYYLSKFDYQINIMRKRNKLNNNNSNESSDEDNIKSTIISKISELLSIEESKLNFDFRLIDYGLDSLVIVQLKNWIDKEFGHHLITIQQLQNNKISTSIDIILKELNNQNKSNKNDMNSSKNSNSDDKSKLNEEEFIKQEIKMDDSIISKPYSIETILNNPNKSIFLTGSTGFLGAYLLFDLIQLEHVSKVYCLLRNKTNQTNPLNEILNNLKYHKLYEKLNEDQLSKIKSVIGNISEKRLGLSEKDYQLISNECDIIINSAADLDLQNDYNSNKKVNLVNIKEIVQLSCSNKTQKLIVQFSSLSVFINHKLNGQEYDETILPKLNNISIGYIQCKIVAERLLMNIAETKGIPSIIIRPPDILSNPETGIGHSNDVLQVILQSSTAVGHYPNIYSNTYCSPITSISKNIKNIIFNKKSWSINTNSIINLNGNPIEMKSIYEILTKNYNCKEIDFEKWKELVAKSKNESCIKYTLFHSFNDHYFIRNASIEQGFKMSNKTKEFLISINSYDENDWIINEEMLINNINHNVFKK